jgi:hypothetical protein
MSYQTPHGWYSRATVLDDSLPHQIRLSAITGRPRPTSNGSGIAVSCTCRRNWAGHGYFPFDDPVMPTSDVMAIWRRNHREWDSAHEKRLIDPVA